MTTRILVTGATGNVGRELLAQLSEVEVVTPQRDRVDLARPESLRDCLRGVDAVFLLWPLHSGAALPGVLAEIARHARRVVFLGSGGVRDLSMDRQEELIRRCGLEWTVLRPSTFAVNTRWWAGQIRAGDQVRGSHGGLGMALLHEADIAAVAVRALTADGHHGRVYRLTGPAVLSQAEQVRILGEVLGRPLRWVELDRPAARAQLIADGIPLSFVDVLLDAYATMAAQPDPEITADVAAVTGRPARTFRQWVADHRAEF
ncbi:MULTISPECIES: sugar nucleotide-binding protein [unclassified Crossiella]|uniref:sugar nucleotide-binding protein n=1 Tax=unclassified Crossiella TaxID=2620835 RepID=UPI00200034B5|nr:MULTISPECIES: sugar nucleotide-binding protein [unclassified Crossiella]MCK2242270.1 sugar nucleotide-binding protein [Crossiella sp. S99.2]MCK2254699.1 sugar nucleotide-binding protein [Crossiella sp. S99.1]